MTKELSEAKINKMNELKVSAPGTIIQSAVCFSLVGAAFGLVSGLLGSLDSPESPSKDADIIGSVVTLAAVGAVVGAALGSGLSGIINGRVRGGASDLKREENQKKIAEEIAEEIVEEVVGNLKIGKNTREEILKRAMREVEGYGREQ